MSQYSETIGSFTRTGNYPLEANYIFESEDVLKQFYSDPIAITTLHEGLLKIVKTGTNGKQALYWVVNGENGLEFKVLIEDLQLGNIENQINNILQKIEEIYGTDSPSEIPEELNSILELANAIKELQTKLLNIKEELKAAVGTSEDDIKTYLQTLAYKSTTELSKALHTFLQTTDSNTTVINTWPELQNFLEGYDDTQVLKDILDGLVNNILGDPIPTEPFRTLRKIEDFVRLMQSTLSNLIANLQKELNLTQEGIGLDQDGKYDPDQQTTYLKDATSVMSALRILDSLIAEIVNRGAIYTAKGSVDNLEQLKSITIVKQGDVYNVVSQVTLNGQTYPAYTNFVYIGEDPNQAIIEENWDSLGGVIDLSNYYNKQEVIDLINTASDKLEQEIQELDKKSIKGVKIEGSNSNLPVSEGIVTIPKATPSTEGVMTSIDKTFIDGIRDGNLQLPTPVITGTWTFYNNKDQVVERTSINPVPDINNPTIEQGYKASFSGTYKWTHEEGKKDPTQVQSGSSWTDLPATGINSQTYTTPHVTTNTTVKIGIQAAKTGLMVSGSNVVPASGMDTTVAQKTVTFTTRRYWGTCTSNVVTETDIKGMSSELGAKACTKSGITADTSHYFVYAYPKSLGVLSGIIQDGATPVLTAFTQQELIITNSAGLSIPLYVYRSNNKGAFTNVTLQFS